jgi:hypothetical protein
VLCHKRKTCYQFVVSGLGCGVQWTDHSSAMPNSIPPAAVLINFATSWGSLPRSTRTVRTEGTSVLANSSREAEMSVITMGHAPAAWAAASVTSPIGPAPLHSHRRHRQRLRPSVQQPKSDTDQITNGSPNLNPLLSIPASATASGSSSAPSSNEMLSGRRWSHLAGWR